MKMYRNLEILCLACVAVLLLSACRSKATPALETAQKQQPPTPTQSVPYPMVATPSGATPAVALPYPAPGETSPVTPQPAYPQPSSGQELPTSTIPPSATAQVTSGLLNTATAPPYPGPQVTATSGGAQQSTPTTGPYPGPAGTLPALPTASPASTRATSVTVTPAFQTTPLVTNTPGRLPGNALTGTPTELPVSTAEPPPQGIHTITIWHAWDQSEISTLEDVLKAYQDTYPDVKFDVLYVPLDELQSKYEGETYLGRGPSIVLAPAEWGPSFFDKGLAADLTGISDAQFLATINPAALGEVQYHGALIGLPYRIRTGVLLFRNKAIISDAPLTFEDLVRSARLATRNGVVGAYLDVSGFYSGAHLNGIGGTLMDGNGNPTFNNSSGSAWLSLLKSFGQAGLTDQNSSRDLDLFKAGKVGFVIGATYDQDSLSSAIGAQNLTIDPWPAYGNGHLSGYIQTDNLYLNANLSGDERAAALQFMGFFLTPEIQTIMTRARHIPVVLNATENDPLMRQAVLALEKGTPYPILPEASAFWDPIEAAISSVLDGSLAPDATLQQANQDVIDRLERMHSGK
ncbi:MAG: extracellular solute-binding protein [Omnitrophica WOR_2 bacterium]